MSPRRQKSSEAARLPGIFLWVWLGQYLSVLGSQLSGFGLGVALYQRTGSTFLYGLTIAATVTPQVVLAPLAGVIVDRFDRRKVLLVEQLGASVCVALMLLVIAAWGLLAGPLILLTALG